MLQFIVIHLITKFVLVELCTEDLEHDRKEDEEKEHEDDEWDHILDASGDQSDQVAKVFKHPEVEQELDHRDKKHDEVEKWYQLCQFVNILIFLVL